MTSKVGERAWGPPKKGFREPAPQWYIGNDILFDRKEHDVLVNYLQEMFKVLTTEGNPVRWEEYGVCNDIKFPMQIHLDSRNLVGMDRIEFIRRSVLDDITWRIAGILRYTYPLRLGEALKPLECCWDTLKWMNRPKVLSDTYDPVLRIFLAVAREQIGGGLYYDTETVKMLHNGIIYHKKVGPRNFMLACCALVRLYRRIGRAQEAQEMVQVIAQKIDGHKYQLTPFEYLQNMDTETRRRVTVFMGHDPFDGIVNVEREIAFDKTLNAKFQTGMKPGQAFGTRASSDQFDGHPLPDIPLETDKRPLASTTMKRECWVSGCRTRLGLKQCASCATSFYCSKEHQKEAWPRHKQLCSKYKSENQQLQIQTEL